ncbi:MAG: ribosomal L7Ae/L30e/S12e/Gadd45 family protein [Desulfitobacteriia bacterium]|jgi:large subunit ribosomal protein L7A
MLDDSIKKAAKIVVGLKQTLRALENDEVQRIYFAKDADALLIKPVLELANSKQVEIYEVQSMSELGRACGIKVGASVAAILEF